MVKPGSSQRKKSTCTEPSTGFSVLSPGRLSNSSLHWAELEPDTWNSGHRTGAVLDYWQLQKAKKSPSWLSSCCSVCWRASGQPSAEPAALLNISRLRLAAWHPACSSFSMPTGTPGYAGPALVTGARKFRGKGWATSTRKMLPQIVQN